MPARARPEVEPSRLLEAALSRWADTRRTDTDEDIAAALLTVRTFALAAIADELHEIRWLIWRHTRAPNETSAEDARSPRVPDAD
jgi:hypothetical protein